MSGFYVLTRPYPMAGDQNSVVYRVQATTGELLHNDRTLHTSIVRVTAAGRTWAGFGTEDEAYLAINDYYVMHGQHTPYVRVSGEWCNAGVMNTGQTTDWAEPEPIGSEPMDFL